MARYVVKIKDKVTKGKGDPVDVDTRSIDIGSRSECVVHLDDPVAAERHAQIVFDAGIFRIEDLGSAVGTFVNGKPAEEPTGLKDGDSIVIGITRFDVTITDKGGAPQLELAGEIGGFAYEDGDLDAWVEDEVKFGRYPALRNANWFMVFALVLLLPALLLDAVDEPLFDPGPLSPSHAALFAMDLDAEPEGRIKDLAALAQEQGCAVCHDTFDRTPMHKCVVCHETLMAEQHPFQTTPGGDPELADRLYQEHDCMLCHVDHRGTDVELRGTFLPLLDDVPGTCSTCHDDVAFDPAAVGQELVEPPRDRATEIHYDTFPHAAHLQEGKAVACEVCHAVPPERKPRASEPERDFASVQFETCTECHARDEADRNEAYRESWTALPAELLFQVDWHGTDDDGSHCLRCHAELNDAALLKKQTSRPAARAWELTRRDHAELFGQGHPRNADGRACENCHLDGPPATLAKVVGTFWHAVHVTDLDAAGGDDPVARARTVTADCEACHVEVLAGGSLADHLSSPRYEGPAHEDGSECSTCHSPTRESPVSLVNGLAPMDWPPTVARNDFPHGAHLDASHPTLERGCFACHEFSDVTDGGPFSRLPVTPPDVLDCSRCHAETRDGETAWHANVGGGACTWCHRAGDPVYSGKPRVDKQWPAYTRFDHYSPGHYGPTTDGECAQCHAGIEDSRSIFDAAVPTEAEASCRACHIQEKKRFHWR